MAVITISRQVGSGGDEIAERLCDRLGYRYFDKEVLRAAASEAGLCENDAIDFSEDHYKARDLLTRLFSSRPRTVRHVLIREEEHGPVDTLTARALDEEQCVELVRYAVTKAYDEGDMVIVGRGGQAILAGKPGVLHVRIVAPFDHRIRRLREQGVSGVSELKLTIAERDRATAEYLRRFFGIRWDDPTLYHLVINTGLLGLEAATETIIEAAQHFAPAATG